MAFVVLISGTREFVGIAYSRGELIELMQSTASIGVRTIEEVEGDWVED